MENINNSHTTDSKKNLKSPPLNRKQIEAKIENLKKFFQNFDPYQEIKPEDKDFLISHQIVHFDDPFHITNQLLLIVEDLVEELEEMKK